MEHERTASEPQKKMRKRDLTKEMKKRWQASVEYQELKEQYRSFVEVRCYVVLVVSVSLL